MTNIKYILFIFCVLICFSTAHAQIKTKTLTYEHEGTTMVGYLAYPENLTKENKKAPGILVVHEWWGQTDYPRKRARMMAKDLGHVALAVDMYGSGKTTTHPKEAGKFSSKIKKDLPKMKGRFMAAMEALKNLPQVNDDQIGAIGYCFGGSVVLEMARTGVPLGGVVSFHGGLSFTTPVKKGDVKAKVLVLNGADDPFVKKEQIKKFKKEMKKAGADFKFINYPNATHGFSNPEATEKGKKFNLPLAYNEKVDKKSWQKMKEFFRELFSK